MAENSWWVPGTVYSHIRCRSMGPFPKRKAQSAQSLLVPTILSNPGVFVPQHQIKKPPSGGEFLVGVEGLKPPTLSV